jgi:hypothetical protein
MSGRQPTLPIITALSLALAVSVLLFIPPFGQDPDYHLFVDQRSWLGIPNFWNVFSNAGFVVLGFMGCLRQSDGLTWKIFFTGVLLTGFGSGWYHLNPTNSSLVWDRLPMTIGFMGLFTAVIDETCRIRRPGTVLAAMMAIGFASVVYWHFSELRGQGDLRLYGLVQFLPIAVIPLLLFTRQSRYTHQMRYFFVLGWYLAAKVAEALDENIMTWTGQLISGHSLKHIFAAVAIFEVLRMLKRRQPINTSAAS